MHKPHLAICLTRVFALLLLECTVRRPSPQTVRSVPEGTTTPAALLVLAPPDFAARVDRIAQEAVRSGATAGLAVAVVERGRTLVSKGYGYANLELRSEVRPETVFRIGSISKQFTATAILQLVEQGKLRLDEEVAAALPAFPSPGQHLTIAHLPDQTP